MAEFGEYLLRSEVEGNLVQAFKSVVKLATGQGIRPLRAADAIPFAAGARVSLYADTRRLVQWAESYTQVWPLGPSLPLRPVAPSPFR